MMVEKWQVRKCRDRVGTISIPPTCCKAGITGNYGDVLEPDYMHYTHRVTKAVSQSMECTLRSLCTGAVDATASNTLNLLRNAAAAMQIPVHPAMDGKMAIKQIPSVGISYRKQSASSEPS